MATPMEQFTAMVQNKTVSVIGIGVSNRPLVHMLCKAGAIVTARDKNPVEHPEELEALGVRIVTGEDYLRDLTEELIFKTPGMRFDVPELVSARAQGSTVTSEMEVFFALCPSPKTIAVTGSYGKTTTTTLIAKMLEAGGHKVSWAATLVRRCCRSSIRSHRRTLWCWNFPAFNCIPCDRVRMLP